MWVFESRDVVLFLFIEPYKAFVPLADPIEAVVLNCAPAALRDFCIEICEFDDG